MDNWCSLLKVLSRFFTKDLLPLRLVSKGWLCLICEHSFIQQQLKKTEPISGFFYQGRHKCLEHFKAENDVITFIPIASASKAYTNVLDFLPDDVVILNSSYGLICGRSAFPASIIFPNFIPEIYIFNPLTKEWKKIQWSKLTRESCISFSFDPLTENRTNGFANFNVVIAEKSEETSAEGNWHINFDIYSSETEAWTRSESKCVCKHNLKKKGSICVNGNLYWLTDGDEILKFDPTSKISQLIMVPHADTKIKFPRVCIGESDGELHYVLISEHGLQLWVLKDSVFQWDCTYTIPLQVLEREVQKQNQNHMFDIDLLEKLTCDQMIDYHWWIEILCFKDDMILIRVALDILLYDFKKGKLKHMGKLDDIGPEPFFCGTALPFTLSLFLLRH